MKAVYCTVTSHLRLLQALVLQESIARHSPSAVFAFFCIDREAAMLVRKLALPNVLVVEVESFVPADVVARRSTLKVVEFCAVCKPLALTYALANVVDAEWAVWADSDMFAFGNPDAAFNGHEHANVLLTPHRFFLPEFERFEPSVGRYNAGYVAFRRTEHGLAALNWWKDRCLEGCPIVPTADLFGDQKYLNSVPGFFEGVEEAGVGVNCAPWNVFGLEVNGSGAGVMVSDEPLLLYHFQGLRLLHPWLTDRYGSRLQLPAAVRAFIYEPYMAAISRCARRMRKVGERTTFGIDDHYRGLKAIPRIAEQFIRSRNIAFRPFAWR